MQFEKFNKQRCFVKKFLPFTFLLASIIFFAGCGIPKQQYNAKVMEVKNLKNSLSDMTLDNEKLNIEVKQLQDKNLAMANRLAELGVKKGQLATDLAETRKREAKLKREREAQRARMAKYRSVIEKFKSLVTSGKLKIRIVRGRMVVEMASNILFPSGKATLLDEGEEALAELAKILRTISGRELQITGHTDNVPIHKGKFKSNWELSTQRAVTVVKFLQGSGVDPKRLSASGYAQYQPAKDNDTSEGKAANRRIEIVLMPNLDELPDLSEIEGELDIH